MERDLSALIEHARQRLGVVSTAELNGFGFTTSAIRANLDASRWQRVHHGVYVLHTGALSWPTRAWAALTFAGPSAVLSYEAAAHTRGWEPRPPEVVDVTVPYGTSSRGCGGVRIHRSRAFLHIVAPDLLPPRTTASRTVLDLLRRCGSTQDAAAAVLEAIRTKRTDSAALLREISSDKRHPWRAVVQSVAVDAAGGLHSILEIRYRDLERAHGLPSGRRQTLVWRNARREFQDVFYDDFGVVVELDGRIGHESTSARLRDRRRDNRNSGFGLTTLRYGYVDLELDGCESIKQVASLLRRAGWRGRLRQCEVCAPTSAITQLSAHTPGDHPGPRRT